MSAGFITIGNWPQFQHYRDRDAPWIKNHARLLHRDEYLALTLHQRGLLHGIWLAYHAAGGQLSADTTTLCRHLGQRVLRRDLDALVAAGFVAIEGNTEAAPRLVENPLTEVHTAATHDRHTTDTRPTEHRQLIQQTADPRNHAGLRPLSASAAFKTKDKSVKDKVLKAGAPKKSGAPLAVVQGDEIAPNAQTLVAYFVDSSTALAGHPPPRRVTGQLAREVGGLLTDGQPADRVRAGIDLMLAKRLHPSVLASLVHEASLPDRRPAGRNGRLTPSDILAHAETLRDAGQL